MTDIGIFRGHAFRTGFIVLEIVRSKHHLLIQHGFCGYTVVYVTSNFWYSTLGTRKLLYIRIISLFCNFLQKYAPPFLYFFTLCTTLLYCYRKYVILCEKYNLNIFIHFASRQDIIFTKSQTEFLMFSYKKYIHFHHNPLRE